MTTGAEKAFLIAGGGGMLGTALQCELIAHGVPFAAPAEHDFDITDPRRVAEVAGSFGAAHPGGVLVNAAAYTNVEKAEDEPEAAYLVNETGPRLLAEAAVSAGLRFVHVSTDFVFDGTKTGPYTERDESAPLSVYGASKLAGERAVVEVMPDAVIVRTAWVFGPAGMNFPKKILEAARTRSALSVVTDECGSPTYTPDLAAGIRVLVEHGATGLFHLAGAGSCSRYELATEILRLAGVSTPIEPVRAAAFPSKAPRPKNSVLDCSKAAALGVTMPHWRDALARFVAELASAE